MVQGEIGYYGLEAVLEYTNSLQGAGQGFILTPTPEPLIKGLLGGVAASDTFSSRARELPDSQEPPHLYHALSPTQDDGSGQFLNSLGQHESFLGISKNESACSWEMLIDNTLGESIRRKIKKQHIRAFEAFADCVVQDIDTYSSALQGGIGKENLQRL
jgi:hypothetical protein